MSKNLYKVTLTGWVIKDDGDTEIMNWPKETILSSMMGEQIIATFIDSNMPRFYTDESAVEVKKDNETKSSEQIVPSDASEVVEQQRFFGNPAQQGIDAAKAEAMEFNLDRYDTEEVDTNVEDEAVEDYTL